MDLTVVDVALFVIFLVVLICPFKVRIVEHNLEVFLFIMGALAVTVTSKWSLDLLGIAAMEPLEKGIVPAVLIAGLLFHYGRHVFQRGVHWLLGKIPLGVFIFAITVILGLLSSVITAIISALLLVEIVNLMPIERKNKINLVIISCFSIGLGAVLTPLGEPLSTIAVSKLSGEPYFATFWYLFDQLGILIVIGVVACGLFGVFYVGRKRGSTEKRMAVAADVRTDSSMAGTTAMPMEQFEMIGKQGASEAIPAAPEATDLTMSDVEEEESDGGLREVLIRTVKVYAFVAALFLLGAGMELIINKYFIQLPAQLLYWINMVSAILDNATLTAAEIGPSMGQLQINAALMGLLISGGMLIPGNIPNIISAGKLGITSGEWAKLGVPLGLVLNAFYFVVIFLLGFSPRLGI